MFKKLLLLSLFIVSGLEASQSSRMQKLVNFFHRNPRVRKCVEAMSWATYATCTGLAGKQDYCLSIDYAVPAMTCVALTASVLHLIGSDGNNNVGSYVTGYAKKGIAALMVGMIGRRASGCSYYDNHF